MGKILGTRCPDCGTKDAPVLEWMDGLDTGRVFAFHCPRCGTTGGFGHRTEDALAAFYGPQPESGESEELPRCRCGGLSELIGVAKDCWWIECLGCYARTPMSATAAEARACWRRMMEE